MTSPSTPASTSHRTCHAVVIRFDRREIKLTYRVGAHDQLSGRFLTAQNAALGSWECMMEKTRPSATPSIWYWWNRKASLFVRSGETKMRQPHIRERAHCVAVARVAEATRAFPLVAVFSVASRLVLGLYVGDGPQQCLDVDAKSYLCDVSQGSLCLTRRSCTHEKWRKKGQNGERCTLRHETRKKSILCVVFLARGVVSIFDVAFGPGPGTRRGWAGVFVITGAIDAQTIVLPSRTCSTPHSTTNFQQHDCNQRAG